MQQWAFHLLPKYHPCIQTWRSYAFLISRIDASKISSVHTNTKILCILDLPYWCVFFTRRRDAKGGCGVIVANGSEKVATGGMDANAWRNIVFVPASLCESSDLHSLHTDSENQKTRKLRQIYFHNNINNINSIKKIKWRSNAVTVFVDMPW
jgi:hypothetical protein